MMTFTENGKYALDSTSDFDLFMKPKVKVKKTGWINIYSISPYNVIGIYKTEQDALIAKGTGCTNTIKIRWEE